MKEKKAVSVANVLSQIKLKNKISRNSQVVVHEIKRKLYYRTHVTAPVSYMLKTTISNMGNKTGFKKNPQ